jgi:hypothetical protein
MASYAREFEAGYECKEDPDYTDYQNNGYVTVGCGSSLGAIVYFISFMFIIRLIFLKLFIALIIDGFKTTQS